MPAARWVIGDIGGTHSRFACASAGEDPGRYGNAAVLRNESHASLQAALRSYLQDLPGERPERAALAVAGPVRGDEVKLLNIGWGFERESLAREFGLSELRVFNDFHAQALALPALGEDERERIGGGEPAAGAAMAVLGPGTGLGMAGLVPADDGGYAAVTGEGGHGTLPAFDDAEAGIIGEIRDELGHCSAERVLSGSGLCRLHAAMHGVEASSAAALSEAAAAGDRDAIATFDQFFRFLGTVAADLALTLGALGGVYVAGGIVPANLALFRRSGFRERFVDKGRYRGYLDAIPTWVVTAKQPALIGLTALISQTDAAPRYL